MLTINHNQATYNLETEWNQDKSKIIVIFTEEQRIPIDIVKDALEETFDIKITNYSSTVKRKTETKEIINYMYRFSVDNNNE